MREAGLLPCCCGPGQLLASKLAIPELVCSEWERLSWGARVTYQCGAREVCRRQEGLG